MFSIEEFKGKEVCVEFYDGEIIAGHFDSVVGSFICVRGNEDHPFLFNDRYIKSIYLKPQGSDNDE